MAAICFCLSIHADDKLGSSLLGAKAGVNKVQSTFWGYSFGSSTAQLQQALKNAQFEPIVDDESGDIYLQGAELLQTSFKTVALYFSPITGGFYKIVASNKFNNKKEAQAFCSQVLANAREAYPNLQQLNPAAPIQKQWVYPDDENVFSLEQLSVSRDDSKTFYVRISYWNRVAAEQIQKARSNK